MKDIADELNDFGIRTTRDKLFTVKVLNKILKSGRYIGEYYYLGIT